jgi:hypothetical protein
LIVQFRKGDAFRIAIELFVLLLLVSHFTEFTLGVGQAKRNKMLDGGIRASPLRSRTRLKSTWRQGTSFRIPAAETRKYSRAGSRHYKKFKIF